MQKAGGRFWVGSPGWGADQGGAWVLLGAITRLEDGNGTGRRLSITRCDHPFGGWQRARVVAQCGYRQIVPDGIATRP